MPYLDATGYAERFGEDELEEVIASSPPATLERAVADASSIVDSYLVMTPNRAFAVPLVSATVPARIVEIVADLARYEIHAKAATNEMKRRRNQAIEFLEALVAGKLGIPELLPPGEPVYDGGAVFCAEERVFTTETLAEYLPR